MTHGAGMTLIERQQTLGIAERGSADGAACVDEHDDVVRRDVDHRQTKVVQCVERRRHILQQHILFGESFFRMNEMII